MFVPAGKMLDLFFATGQDLGVICADGKSRGSFSAGRQRPTLFAPTVSRVCICTPGQRVACVHTLQNAQKQGGDGHWRVSKGPLAPRSNGDQLKAWKLKVEFEDG